MGADSSAYLTGLVTNRDRLRAELDRAETALFVTIKRDAEAGIVQDDDPQIEVARTACRRIRREFEKLERLVEETTPPGRIDSLSAELQALRVHELRKPVAALTPVSDVREPARVASAAHPAPEVQKTPVPEVRAFARRLGIVMSRHAQMIRQSLGLFALVLAYLAYHWLDIKLTIMMLPSVIWNPKFAQMSIVEVLFS